MKKTKNNPRVPIKKIENFIRGILYGAIYVLIVIGAGLIFKFSSKSVAFALICSGCFQFYLDSIKQLDKKRKKNKSLR